MRCPLHHLLVVPACTFQAIPGAGARGGDGYGSSLYLESLCPCLLSRAMVSPVVLEVPGRGVLPRCRSGGEILLAAQPPPVRARPPALALGKRQAPAAGAPHCRQALHSALGHRVLAQPTDTPPFVTLRGVGVLSPRPGFSGTLVCLSVPRSGASPGECRVQGTTLQVWISGEATQCLSGLGAFRLFPSGNVQVRDVSVGRNTSWNQGCTRAGPPSEGLSGPFVPASAVVRAAGSTKQK